MTTADRHTVTVVVRCGFIGCDWSIEIGSAPLEAHNAYLDHLDVHDVEVVDLRKTDDCDQEDDEEVARSGGANEPAPAAPDTFQCPRCFRISHNPTDAREQYCGACNDFFGNGSLYDGDSPEQVEADQARVDRFMAGGEDQ